MKAVRAFWSFARAPLLWSAAISAVYAPLGVFEAVYGPNAPGCDDWLWCDPNIERLVFEPDLDIFWSFLSLFPFVAIAASIVFFAARIAVRGPNPHAHWFMAGPVLAFVTASAFEFFFPFQGWVIPFDWIDSERSDPIALRVTAQLYAVLFGACGAVIIAILTLCGALAWRWLRARSRPD